MTDRSAGQSRIHEWRFRRSSPPSSTTTRRNLVFAAFAVVIAASGAASPHLSWGHLPVSPESGLTLIILVDFVLLFAGFRLYVRSVRKEEHERRLVQERLLNSYRYIGVANRKLEIFAEFVERISSDDDARQVRQRIAEYLPEITAALLGADRTLLRIIDRSTGRTVTEWACDGGAGGRLRMGNRQVLGGGHREQDGLCLFVDAPEGFATTAAIVTDRAPVDEETRGFLKTMLRFLHLTYAYADSCRTRDHGTDPRHDSGQRSIAITAIGREKSANAQRTF